QKLSDRVEPPPELADVTATSGLPPREYRDISSRGRLDAFLQFVIENRVSATEWREIMPVLTRQSPSELENVESVPSPLFPLVVYEAPMQPTQTESEVKKLTIGMATYDDYDGVYFTLQSIRLHHPEILTDAEFVIIDNNPDGPCADALKDLGNWIPNYRYIP